MAEFDFATKPSSSEHPKTKIMRYVAGILNKPPFPASPQQSIINDKNPKQPCYYERGNYYRSIEWKRHQNWHEKESSLRAKLIEKWHKDPRIEGVSTLGGYNGQHWLGWADFDLDNFENKEHQETAIANWLEQYPILKTAPQFRTPSGGYRLLIAFEKEPKEWGANNGFALEPNQSNRCGELLTKNGGHTLLPPSKGENGSYYEWIVFDGSYPPIVDSPDAIGLYKVATAKGNYISNNNQLPNAKGNYISNNNQLPNAKGNYISNNNQLLNNKTYADYPEIDKTELALECLRYLDPDSHYDEWLKIGAALYSVAPGLENEFDKWSSGGSKYKGSKEIATKWRSFSHGTKANIGSLVDMAKANGFDASAWCKDWHKNNLRYRSKRGKSNLINHPTYEPTPIEVIIKKIDELIDSNASPSKVSKTLTELGKTGNFQTRDLRKIYEDSSQERETDKSSSEVKESFRNILDAHNLDLDLYSVLPSELAAAIYDLAEQMPTAPEALLTASLPVWSSGIGTNSRIIVKGSSRYIQPAILRTCIVAKSGERKSPTLKAAMEGVEELEAESRKEYELELTDYEQNLLYYESLPKGEKKNHPQPKPPVAKRYLVKDINIDKLIEIHSNNPKGLLNVVDELAGYFYRMNKFNNGKGDDEQRDLEFFNGSSVIKDRITYSFFIPKTSVSVAGTIQWEVLQRIMQQKGENDPAGILARWLLCAKKMPDPYLDLFSETDSTNYKELQKNLFNYLRNLPEQDYLLSDEAKTLLQHWQHGIVEKLKSETLEPMAIAYPKFESYVFRLALILHLVESYWSPTVDSVISGETAKRAILLINWFIGQYRYVLAKNSPQECFTGELLAIKEFLEKKGFATPTNIKKFNRTLKNLTNDQIKKHFEILVENGIAIWSTKNKTGLRIELAQEGDKSSN